MTKIKQLRDKTTNEAIVPITHPNAIVGNNGESFDEILETFKNDTIAGVDAKLDSKVDKLSIKQKTGNDPNLLMSQDAITKELNTKVDNEIYEIDKQEINDNKVDKTSIKQELGDSETDVVSQKTITENINNINIEHQVLNGYLKSFEYLLVNLYAGELYEITNNSDSQVTVYLRKGIGIIENQIAITIGPKGNREINTSTEYKCLMVYDTISPDKKYNISVSKRNSIKNTTEENTDNIKKIDNICHDITLSEYEIENGGIYFDGTLLNNESQKEGLRRTSFIPVKGDDVVYYSGSLGTDYIPILGYDSKKRFIKGLNDKTTKQTVFTLLRTEIPNGIFYVRATGRSLSEGAINPLKLTIVKKNEDKNVFIERDNIHLKKGFIVNTTNGELEGGIVNGAATDEYLEVLPNSKIAISSLLDGSIGIAGYDSDKIYNSRLLDTSLDAAYTSDKTANRFILTIPDNVHFIKGSTKDNLQNPFKLYDVNTIDGALQTANNEIKEIRDEITFETKYTADTRGKIVDTHNGDAYATEWSVDAECTENYIPVSPGDIIYVSAWFGGQIGVAGYNHDRIYNKQIADSYKAGNALYKVEYADNYKMVVPSEVYYIRAATKDRNTHPLKIRKIVHNKTALTEINKKFSPIRIRRVDETRFFVDVLQPNTYEYISHEFGLEDFTYEIPFKGGIKRVRSSNVWVALDVYHGKEVLCQGNANFIFRLKDDEGEYLHEYGFVGAGHGCDAALWTKFYADGKEFNPQTMDKEINCSSFRMKYKAYIFACDTSSTIANPYTSPKLDENGEMIVSAIHTIEQTFEGNDKIVTDNKLQIQRDNLRFDECYGGMCCVYRPFTSNVIINNKEETFNSFTRVNDNPETPFIVTKEGGSNIDLSKRGMHFMDTVTQWGNGFFIQQKLTQFDNSRRNKTNCRTYFGTATGTNWLKVYQMPVIGVNSEISLGETAEVFNRGDEIRVHLERIMRLS